MDNRILLILLVFTVTQCLASPQRNLNALKTQTEEPKKNPTQAKILKQINTVNDDGSYTFGYEADDGSFKVETRSKDGVVKGKYGFIDPNGQLKTVEYTAGEKSDNPDQDYDLKMAGATDSKSVTKTRQAEQPSSSEEEEEDDEEDNDTRNYAPTPSQESPGPQTAQYPRQTVAGQGQQYFREVSGNGIGGGQQQGINSFGQPVGFQGQNPNAQFADRQFIEGRPSPPTSSLRFPGDSRQLLSGGQFGPIPQQQQFNGQFGGQQRFAAGQSQGQQPYLFPQQQLQGGFVGSQGPIPGNVNPQQQQFGGPGGIQRQQFSPQQISQFGRGSPGLVGGGNIGGAGGQQQFGAFGPQQFPQDFDDQPGFGGFTDFDGLNQYGGNPQLIQRNPNQLLGFGGGRNPGTGNINSVSGRQPQTLGIGAGGGGSSPEYAPSVELDGFSDDSDQDGFVDPYPGSEGNDKKTAQTEEKSPDVKTTDGRQVNNNTPQYTPQILGPQQLRPGLGLQQQQPGFPGRLPPQGLNQFGISPYDDDQFNQLYQQQGQPGIIPQGGRPQQTFPTNPQYLGGFPQQQFGPQYFQPQNFQQRPFLGGSAGGPGGILPQTISQVQGGIGAGPGGLQGQGVQPQQQQLNPTQTQGLGTRPTNGQSDFTNGGAGIQQQYIPGINGQGQQPFLQQPGFGFQQPGFQNYPGYNPYIYGGPDQFGGGPGPGGPYSPSGSGFQGGLAAGPPYQQQSQFPAQAFLGNNNGLQSHRLTPQVQQQRQQQSQQLGQVSQQQLSLGGVVSNSIGTDSNSGGSERVTRAGGTAAAAIASSPTSSLTPSANANPTKKNEDKKTK